VPKAASWRPIRIRPSDEVDATWQWDGIVQDARIDFRTGYAIAQDARIPNWYFGSPFRIRRDRSLRAQSSDAQPHTSGTPPVIPSTGP
jgi:hypothetical protein